MQKFLSRRRSDIKIAIVGENLIDLFKIDGAFKPHVGGSPLNIAVGLARLGESVSYITKFSYDFFGDLLRNTLTSERVNLSLSMTDNTLHTTLAFTFVDERKVPTFEIWNRSTADSALSIEDVSKISFKNFDAVHFGSILFATPAVDAILHLIKKARLAGKFISFDPNYRPKIAKDEKKYRDSLLEGWKMSNVVKCSFEDAKAIFNVENSDEAFEKIKEIKIKAIVTAGEDGAYVVGKETVHIPAYKVHVIDTTGCGDAFMAGVIHKLLKDNFVLDEKILAEAAKFGSATAGIAAQEIGAITSFPRIEEVEKFLKDVKSGE